MTGHVEFRHDAHTAIRGVGNKLAQLFGCVVIVAGKIRIGNAWKAKALIIGQVQMQHVHFQSRQAIDHRLQRSNRKDVPGDIEKQTAPGKAGLILNKQIGVQLIVQSQLSEGRDAAKRTPVPRGRQLNTLRGHLQTIGLIHVQKWGWLRILASHVDVQGAQGK